MPIITKKKKSTITLTKAGKVRKKRRRAISYKGESRYRSPLGPNILNYGDIEYWAGVDVGFKGGMTIFTKDMKYVDGITFTLKNGNYDFHSTTKNIKSFFAPYLHSLFATIEICGPRKNDAKQALAVFMTGYGLCKASLAMLGIGYNEVSPLKWKGEMNLFNTGKEGSIFLAHSLFTIPSVYAKHDGVCESLLIGLYGREFLTNNGVVGYGLTKDEQIRFSRKEI